MGRQIAILNEVPAGAAAPAGNAASAAIAAANPDAAAQADGTLDGGPVEATPAEPVAAPEEQNADEGAAAAEGTQDGAAADAGEQAATEGDGSTVAEGEGDGAAASDGEGTGADGTDVALPEEVQSTLNTFGELNGWISKNPKYVVDFYKEISQHRRLRPDELVAFDNAQAEIEGGAAPEAAPTAGAPAAAASELPKEEDVIKECEELDKKGEGFKAAKKWSDYKDQVRAAGEQTRQTAEQRRVAADRDRAAHEKSVANTKAQFKDCADAYPDLVKTAKNALGFVIVDEPLRQEMARRSKGLGLAQAELREILEVSLVSLGRHQKVKPAAPAPKPGAKPAAKAPAGSGKPVAARPQGATPAPVVGMRRIQVAVEDGRRK